MNSFSLDPVIPNFGFSRARDKAFAAVRQLWRKRQSEGMTQIDLAARLGKDPAWVSRKLSGPSNWTLRTFGHIADALDGEVEIRLVDLNEDDGAQSNYDAFLGFGDNGGLDWLPKAPPPDAFGTASWKGRALESVS